MPTLAELAWLTTPDARAVIGRMAGGESAADPAGIARWRQELESDRVAAAWNQTVLRQKAQAKFARAEVMLFDRVGLEQASDEAVASHKAHRFAEGQRVVDLCCGIGGDAIALAQTTELTAIDRDPVRSYITSHNISIYEGSAEIRTEDVTFVDPTFDAIHIDPDRRAQGPRRHAAEAASPDLTTVARLIERVPAGAVKLAPGIDFAQLPFPAEIELISHQGQCKQAVAWTGRLRQGLYRATVLPAGESLTVEHEAELTWPAPRALGPGLILYEPDPAVIRAQLVGPLARRLNAAPIDPRIAYLLGDELVQTPLATAFQIRGVRPFSAKDTRAWLAQEDIGEVELKTRGFAASPEELLRKIKPRGHGKASLFVTRADDRTWAILADRQTVFA